MPMWLSTLFGMRSSHIGLTVSASWRPKPGAAARGFDQRQIVVLVLVDRHRPAAVAEACRVVRGERVAVREQARSLDRPPCGIQAEQVGAADQLVQLAVVDEGARVVVGHLAGEAHGPPPVASHWRTGQSRTCLRAARRGSPGVHARSADGAAASDDDAAGPSSTPRRGNRSAVHQPGMAQHDAGVQTEGIGIIVAFVLAPRCRARGSARSPDRGRAVVRLTGISPLDRKAQTATPRPRRRRRSGGPCCSWSSSPTGARPAAEHGVRRRASPLRSFMPVEVPWAFR